MWIRETGAGPSDGVGHGFYSLALADNALVQRILHAQQFFPLPFQHLADRDAGPLGNDLGDLLLGDLVAQQAFLRLLGFLRFGRNCKFLFELGNDTVLDFRHPGQVTGTASGIQLEFGLLQIALDLGFALQGGFLRLPDFLQIGVFPLDLVDIRFQFFQALFRRFVLFLAQRLALHLQLDQAPLQAVHFLGLGIDFHADAACRLVNQIDGLVG